MTISGRIGRVLIGIQQRFARSPFRVDHIVACERDMEELQFVALARVIQRDRRAVDQAARRHQDAVDEQGVRLGNVQIGMRNIGTKGGAGDPNRPGILDPCLGRIIFF